MGNEGQLELDVAGVRPGTPTVRFPLNRPGHSRSSVLLISLAIGTLFCFNSWVRLALIPGDIEYHVEHVRWGHVVLVAIVNTLFVAGLAAVLLVLSGRFRSQPGATAGSLFLLSFLALGLLRCSLFLIPFPSLPPFFLGSVNLLAFALVTTLLGFFLLRRRSQLEGGFLRMEKPLSVLWLLMFAAFASPLLLAWARSQPASSEGTSSQPSSSVVAAGEASVPATASPAPSIVWVILDEFDASVAFEHRPASMHLPHLDQFRSESISFRRATSPGSFTVTVIPSLFSGIPFTRVLRKERSDLILATAESSEEYSFRNTPSVIDWANDSGVPVTLVGWTHPYCRVFGERLAQCAWYPNDQMSPAQIWASALRDLSFPQALLAALRQDAIGAPAGSCLDGPNESPSLDTLGYASYRTSLKSIVSRQRQDVRRLLSSGPAGLRILHLATPHLPAALESPTGDGGVAGVSSAAPSVVNNFATADAFFGEIRAILEQRGEWDSSLVIVTSDHGLRSFWENWICFSEEDSRMFAHRDELRVPLIVKWPRMPMRPEGDAPLVIDQPVSTLMLAPLLRAYLENRIQTPKEFDEFIRSRLAGQPQTQLAQRSPSE